MKISVAVCTYNGNRFIEEQLISIIKQSRPPDEIVIADDKSSDNTVSIVKNILRSTKIPTKLVVNDINIGFANNFSQAITKCSGDAIFLSDQDDIWDLDKIDIICRILYTRPDIAGLTHEGKIVDENRVWYGTYKNDQFRRGYGPNKRAITGALSVIRSRYAKLLIPFPTGIGHDIWFDYVFSFFPNFWMHINECLTDIRRHAENTSQFPVNSFSNIDRYTIFRHQLCTSPASTYSDRILMNQCLNQKILSIDPSKDLFDKASCSSAILRLASERTALEAREIIATDQRRISRVARSCRLLGSGGYSFFNGWRSFLRDVVR